VAFRHRLIAADDHRVSAVANCSIFLARAASPLCPEVGARESISKSVPEVEGFIRREVSRIEPSLSSIEPEKLI
jgi:hypothetical protein